MSEDPAWSRRCGGCPQMRCIPAPGPGRASPSQGPGVSSGPGRRGRTQGPARPQLGALSVFKLLKPWELSGECRRLPIGEPAGPGAPSPSALSSLTALSSCLDVFVSAPPVTCPPPTRPGFAFSCPLGCHLLQRAAPNVIQRRPSQPVSVPSHVIQSLYMTCICHVCLLLTCFSALDGGRDLPQLSHRRRPAPGRTCLWSE